jgi:NADH-quinone oxidoreductase subunit H
VSEPLPVDGVLLLPVLLLALAWVAATVSAAVGAATAGRPVVGELAAPLREVVRLLHVRRRTTLHPDALLWRLGGGAVLVTALLAFATVPVGDRAVVASAEGVVWFNAAETLLWAVLWLTGWGANSVAGLVGGYRFLALAVAYELPFMLALITAAIPAASLDPAQIAAAQGDLWSVVVMPVAFAVYVVAALGFCFYGPFSQPVTGDVAGGLLAELSGVDRLVVLVGQYAWLTAAAAMAVPLFLGGGSGPLLPPIAWQLVKTLLVLGLLIVLRWRLPLVRAERFEELAWVVLLPAILLQALVVAVLAL